MQPMNANPVVWFEIYVQDMARAKRFYETVLGLTLERLGDPNDAGLEMQAFPGGADRSGASGALARYEGFPSGGNSTLVYFSCEDCAVEEGRIAGAGGKVERPKMSIGEYGFISLGIDTEGNMFGLHSMK
jgi:predicted enzyme related to lactoylglutathione lyase